jgi:cell shape-determining protein MreC
LNLRFGHIFTLSMLVSLLLAVTMSDRMSRRITGAFQWIFLPISGPIHYLAGTVGHTPELQADDDPLEPTTQTSDEQKRLEIENRKLREQVARLTAQISTLKVRVAEADQLGTDLGQFAESVRVLAKADGPAEQLKLLGSSRPLSGGEVVVYLEAGRPGLAGKIMEGVAPGNGSTVRLITDRRFPFTVRFGRSERNSDGTIAFKLLGDELQAYAAEGMGGGEIRVDGLKMSDVESMQLKPGDLVQLAGPDTTWPLEAIGLRVGAVTAVSANRLKPGFAEIRVRPEASLLELKKVLVIAKPESP